MNVAAIILAAGASSRFEDGQKLLAEIDGIPIVRRVCSAVARSVVGDDILVVAERDGAVARAAGEGRWRIVENSNARDGLSSSLRAGLEHVEPDADGAAVVLADMPGITSDLIDELISAFSEADGRAIVFPESRDGRQGHPVIWPRDLFPELLAIRGDKGAKEVLARYQNRWKPVVYEFAGAYIDIDTTADLGNFRAPQPSRRR